VVAEILVALVAVEIRGIGKAEHDTLLCLLVLLMVSKMWTWVADLVLN